MSTKSIRTSLSIAAVGLLTALAAIWILGDGSHPHRDEAAHGHDHGHGHDAHEEEMPRGPHGGRLLEEGAFALEITIFEKGVPPEFHIYPYSDGNPVAPDDVDLKIELGRLDGQVDSFDFRPQADYLRGDGIVTEPHSFDVSVSAVHQGQSYQWQYENYEGRTEIAAAMAEEAGIQTEPAGPATIRETLMLTGRIHANPARLSRVRARFPGMVKSVQSQLGEAVRAGDVLAKVQSNESLETYSVKAPIDGILVQREIQVGEATGTEPLFTIADLSEVWVEFDVFGDDLNRVRSGQAVAVQLLDGQRINGSIDWISPLATHTSQSVQARVALPNPYGLLRPGQFVRGEVTIAEHQVPLAVRVSGLQGFRDFKVVFARVGETYEVRMLELGRRDPQWVEVLGGLKPGTEYVTENSYLIKADIEKSGASHDH
jgi:cobalt-zinc-cadmium efflux system membrane fusion protein